jgi:hypothetical protein
MRADPHSGSDAAYGGLAYEKPESRRNLDYLRIFLYSYVDEPV